MIGESMERRQIKRALDEYGYAFMKVPGLTAQPKATYYTRNKNTGEVVEMRNLPADPYSLHHYLAKGFVLDKSQLKPQAVGLPQEGEFVCEVCGKSFKAQIALRGHMRSHKK